MNFSQRTPRRIQLVLAMVITLQVGVATAFACDSCQCHPGHSSGEHGHAHPSSSLATSFNSWVRPNGNQKSLQGRRQPITFAVVGDTQNGEFGGGVLTELTRDIHALNPDYVLFPGDLIGDTGLNGWQAWAATTADLGNRRLMTPGNHDRGPNDSFANWQSTFGWLPNSQSMNGQSGIDKVDYFVDAGNVRFVSVSTDRPGQFFGGGDPPALAWMREVMRDVDTRNADADPLNDIDHVFTFSHRPVTTQLESGTGGVDGTWWQTMTGQSGKIDSAATALLAGHWHMYQPSRPDPAVDTMEIISGTGGGGLEGAPHRNRHGFSLITVDGGTVTSQFFGDRDGSTGGWNFVDSMDAFTITQEGGLPVGELAHYDFEIGGIDLDSSTSPLSKGHRLNLHGSAGPIFDVDQGHALQVSAGGNYVDAKNIGDNNLAVLRDISISISARADSPGDGGTLVAFGGAHGAFNGSLAGQESANHAYRLSMTDAGFLELAWQYDDGLWDSVLSSETVDNTTDWHEYLVARDADSRGVAFYVDGDQLGEVLAFDHLPTGGGSGSLYLGAGIGGSNGFSGRIDDFRLATDPVSLVPSIVGDFNADGRIDEQDWLFFADGLGRYDSPATDFDGDGFTGHADFLFFQSLFEDFNGPGSFAEMLQSIPEPQGGLLMGMVACGFWFRQRKRAEG